MSHSTLEGYTRAESPPTSVLSACEPFEGNADFYGLGIRIGIYLQWVSAWLSMLLDPESAERVLDANSAFVFTLVIATIIFARHNAAGVEIYIMLQILFGFFITTLSTFGIRVWLMSPDRLDALRKQTTTLWRNGRRKRGEAKTQSQEDWRLPMQLSLTFFSSLKFPGLSWSGVVQRTGLVAMLTGFNLAYWFAKEGHGVQRPPNPGCGPPTVFMFSEQLLAGNIISLGRTVAVMTAVVVFPPTLALLLLTLRLFWYALLFLYRDVVSFLVSAAPQSFQDTLGRVNHVLRNKGVPILQGLEFYYSPVSPAIFNVRTALAPLIELLGFMTSSKADDIRLSDVLKAGVSIGVGKPVMRQAQQCRGLPLGRPESMLIGWSRKT